MCIFLNGHILVYQRFPICPYESASWDYCFLAPLDATSIVTWMVTYMPHKSNLYPLVGHHDREAQRPLV